MPPTTMLAECAACSVLVHVAKHRASECPRCHGSLDVGLREVGFHDAREVYGAPDDPWQRPPERVRAKFVCHDGHKVHSAPEKIIDDWLHARGILHEREPKVMCMRPDRGGRAKREAPSGAGPPREDAATEAPRRALKWMRPDWRVGNVYVEYWGMAGQQGYEARREEKLAAYRRRKLRLVEVFPEDLDRLGAKLGHLVGDSVSQPMRWF